VREDINLKVEEVREEMNSSNQEMKAQLAEIKSLIQQLSKQE